MKNNEIKKRFAVVSLAVAVVMSSTNIPYTALAADGDGVQVGSDEDAGYEGIDLDEDGEGIDLDEDEKINPDDDDDEDDNQDPAGDDSDPNEDEEINPGDDNSDPADDNSGNGNNPGDPEVKITVYIKDMDDQTIDTQVVDSLDDIEYPDIEDTDTKHFTGFWDTEASTEDSDVYYITPEWEHIYTIKYYDYYDNVVLEVSKPESENIDIDIPELGDVTVDDKTYEFKYWDIEFPDGISRLDQNYNIHPYYELKTQDSGNEGYIVLENVYAKAYYYEDTQALEVKAFYKNGVLASYPWFDYSKSIKTVSFDDSITFIGDYAFNSIQLTSDDYTFTPYSNLTGSIVLPESLTYIGKQAFAGCSGLTGSLIIPDSVTTIEDRAFNNCEGLTGSLVIPDSVTTIGDYAFYNCSGFNGTLTIGNSVKTIGDFAFNGDFGFKGNFKLGNSVTTIGEYAFYGCSGLKGNINFPNTVTSIGTGAFSKCSSLTGDATIPNSVTIIESSVFQGCTGLNGKLTLGNKVTSIGSNAFSRCGFTSMSKLPDTLTEIGYQAFFNCDKLTGNLIIPDSVTSIGNQAFSMCSSLGSKLTLGSGLKTLSLMAFYGCSGITNIDLTNCPLGSTSEFKSLEFDLITYPGTNTTVTGWTVYDTDDTSSLTYSSIEANLTAKNRYKAADNSESLVKFYITKDDETTAFNGTVDSDGHVVKPSNVTRDGYVLAGWSTDPDASLTSEDEVSYFDFDFETVSKESYPNGLKLYAVWAVDDGSITIILKSSANSIKATSSSYGLDSDTKLGVYVVKPGESFTLPNIDLNVYGIEADHQIYGWIDNVSAGEETVRYSGGTTISYADLSKLALDTDKMNNDPMLSFKTTVYQLDKNNSSVYNLNKLYGTDGNYKFYTTATVNVSTSKYIELYANCNTRFVKLNYTDPDNMLNSFDSLGCYINEYGRQTKSTSLPSEQNESAYFKIQSVTLKDAYKDEYEIIGWKAVDYGNPVVTPKYDSNNNIIATIDYEKYGKYTPASYDATSKGYIDKVFNFGDKLTYGQAIQYAKQNKQDGYVYTVDLVPIIQKKTTSNVKPSTEDNKPESSETIESSEVETSEVETSEVETSEIEASEVETSEVETSTPVETTPAPVETTPAPVVKDNVSRIVDNSEVEETPDTSIVGYGDADEPASEVSNSTEQPIIDISESTEIETESTLDVMDLNDSSSLVTVDDKLYVGTINSDSENQKSALAKFVEVAKTVGIVVSISLLGVLGVLGLLLLIAYRKKRIKVYNNINVDMYKEDDFKLLYKSTLSTEGNIINELFKQEDRVWKLLIPEYVLADRVTDTFKIELTSNFCKKHNGEQIIVVLENEDKSLEKSLGFVIDEANTVIEFGYND